MLDPLLDFVLEFLLRGLGRLAFALVGRGRKSANPPSDFMAGMLGVALWIAFCLAIVVWLR